MSVEHITPHTFQGKVVLQIEVSMSPDMRIRYILFSNPGEFDCDLGYSLLIVHLFRDAMEMAEQAEKEVLKAFSNIIHASIQLRLGRPVSKFNHT